LSSTDDDIELFAVKRRKACKIFDCGPTTLRQLVAAGELESVLDGGLQKITMASIRARQARLLAAAGSGTGRERTAAATAKRMAKRAAPAAVRTKFTNTT
jgi:hypothetical protein